MRVLGSSASRAEARAEDDMEEGGGDRKLSQCGRDQVGPAQFKRPRAERKSAINCATSAFPASV